MKKSISILSIAVILLFSTGRKDETPSLRETGSLVTRGFLADQFPMISCASFTADEGENPPWKDPWQWIQIFRKLWQF